MKMTRLARFAAVTAVVMLVAAGCNRSLSIDATTTEASTTSVTPTTTIVAGTPVNIIGCDDAAEEFELLCDAYRVVKREYVDSVDDAVLMAGAIEAIEAYAESHSSVAPATTLVPGSIECAVPTDAFAPFCEAFAEERIAGTGPAASLVEAAVRGLLGSLDDPATTYLDLDALERLNEDQSGEVEGIGALVWAAENDEPCSPLSTSCRMTIVSVITGSPAEASGIRAGDQVIAVDGESIEGWTLDEAVAAVRGPAGSDVRLGVARAADVLDIVVTRAAILVPAVESEMAAAGVGYIRLSYFPSNAGGQFRDALGALLDEGASRIILDLQGNPGGSLQASIVVASQFLGDGSVVVTEAPDGDTVYPVQEGGVATDEAIELWVLVNRGSASASEVVAGVLQETGRATIVGESTFGKNTVQQQFNLPSGGAVKVTTARWVTPGGLDFGKDGIEPDVVVEYPDDAGLDFLLEWLLNDLDVVATP
jgi:carboxyl-terminal processing protease